jgi:hypothetical protein
MATMRKKSNKKTPGTQLALNNETMVANFIKSGRKKQP